MSEDLAHDAHLRAALRHAPDHALAPPSGLSQTILSAARQAHRPVRATPAPPPVQMRPAGHRPLVRWLRRLFAPRWAGAWATGLVAALGLGLWLDLGVQPVIERPAAVATASAPPVPPANATTTPAAPRDTAADDARTAAEPNPSAPSRAGDNTPALTTLRAAPRVEPPAERAVQRSGETSAGATDRQTAESPNAPTVRRDTTAQQPATTGAVAATPDNGRRSTDALSNAQSRAAMSAPAAPAPDASAATEPAGRSASEPRARLALGEARKAEAGGASAAASPASTLLRRAQGELASGSARWTWTAPGAVTMAPFDDAAQAWLSRVVQLASGRWVDVSERGEGLDALEVRWWRDGWPHATLRIEAQGLRWIEPSGLIRYAPLDAAMLQRLRSF